MDAAFSMPLVRVVSVLIGVSMTAATAAQPNAQSTGRASELPLAPTLRRAQTQLAATRIRAARHTLRRAARHHSDDPRFASLALRLLPTEVGELVEPAEPVSADAQWLVDQLGTHSGAEARRATAWAEAILGRAASAIGRIVPRPQDLPAADQLRQIAALMSARRELHLAEAALRRALRIYPQSRDLQRDLAAVLVARGRPDHAVHILLTMVRDMPDDRLARRDLGGVLLALGRGDEALATLRELARSTDEAGDHLRLAEAALELGRHGVAEEAARVAIQRGSRPGHSVLALALAAQGRRDAALEALTRAPNDSRARRARRALEQP